MLDNKIFRMLFDPRGIITRREYWAGLILLLMITSASYIEIFFGSFSSMLYGRNSQETLLFSIYFGGALNMLQPKFIPYIFIFLFCSFVITIKRCRTLGYNRYTGWILGLFTYLLFAGLRTLFYIGMIISSSINDPSMDDMGIYPAMFYLAGVLVLFVVLGIILIVVLSRKVELDNTVVISRNYDSFRYIFDQWKLGVVYIVIGVVVLLCWSLFSSGNYHYLDIIGQLTIIQTFLSFVYLCVYIAITIRRVQDAGVNIILFLSILFVYIMITGGMVCLYYIKEPLFSNSKILVFIAQFYYWLVNIVTVLCFILIALPSKEVQKTEV